MIRPLLITLFSAITLCAQEVAQTAEDPAHRQLRELRGEMLAAIESRDIERMLSHVHPDIVTTWQDGTTTHGVDELRDFYERIGKNAFVSYKVPHTTDRLSVLHGGDTAIAAGRIVANYKLLGRDYEFASRWTATLVLVDGKWQVAAYHVSLNALDNPILDAAKTLLWIAGVAGLVVGCILTWLMMRKRRAG